MLGSVLWLAEGDARESVGALESVKRKGDNIMHYLKKGMDFRELGKYIAYLSTYQNLTIKLLLGQIDCISGEVS